MAGPVDESNFLEWEAVFLGPSDTPYEFGVFRARITFPADYPHNPVRWCLQLLGLVHEHVLTFRFVIQPKMVFITPIWHPNIYHGGAVRASGCGLLAWQPLVGVTSSTVWTTEER